MQTSLWIQESAPFEATLQPLPENAEVAVIGGGVAGISVALGLARRGVDVIVLEADVVAGRASGRNDGQLLLGLGEHYNRIVGQFGADRARILWAFIRANNDALKSTIAEYDIACHLQQGGGLRLAESEHEWSELADAAVWLRREEIAHELIPAEQVPEHLPAVGFHGALQLPGEAIVQPVELVRGLARAALGAGATIHEHTPVEAIHGSAGEFTIVTGRGAIRAGIVVHCTSALAVNLDTTGFLGRQLFPFRGQIIATDPLPATITERFGNQAMSSNFCYEYFRMHESRFVVGGMRWSVKGEEQGTTDDGTTNPEVAANLLGYVRRHFPVLDGVGFPNTWTGIMAGTMDGLPLLGAIPGQSGAFCNLGYNGYGLSFALLAGRVLTEQILDGRASHDGTALFAPRRFT